MSFMSDRSFVQEIQMMRAGSRASTDSIDAFEAAMVIDGDTGPIFAGRAHPRWKQMQLSHSGATKIMARLTSVAETPTIKPRKPFIKLPGRSKRRTQLHAVDGTEDGAGAGGDQLGEGEKPAMHSPQPHDRDGDGSGVDDDTVPDTEGEDVSTPDHGHGHGMQSRDAALSVDSVGTTATGPPGSARPGQSAGKTKSADTSMVTVESGVRLDGDNLKLPRFPDIIRNQNQEVLRIRRLSLCNNSIEVIPPEISTLKALKEVYLRKNRIRIIPNEFCTLSDLELCDLSYNEISVIPGTINKLHKLRSLDISFNNVGTLPGGMEGLKSLKVFQARNNYLNFAPVLCTMQNLQVLSLHHNWVRSVPSQIKDLKKLKTLILSQNKLGDSTAQEQYYIPESMAQVKGLERLHLRGNPHLKDLPPPVIIALTYVPTLDVDRHLLLQMAALLEKSHPGRLYLMLTRLQVRQMVPSQLMDKVHPHGALAKQSADDEKMMRNMDKSALTKLDESRMQQMKVLANANQPKTTMSMLHGAALGGLVPAAGGTVAAGAGDKRNSEGE
eukprot:GFYU01004026.1.p1 GENE.GFYU01004026.1~~GFYU01004026.1.p1  ORF type:complete len:554 (-),score=126.73 GFYU01004026.1:229-1890(-)